MVSVTKTTAALLVLLLWVLTGPTASAQAQTLDLGEELDVGELSLALGKSRVVTAPVNLSQVVVGNPEIADVRILSSRRVLLLGQQAGRTNLAFRDDDDNVVAVLDLVVSHDVEGLKRKLHELLPDERDLEVRVSNAAVILSGEVSDARAMELALTTARSFAGDADVKNMMQVGGGQQVMLEVRVAEVRRNALREMGVQSIGRGDTDSTGYSVLTGQPIPGEPIRGGSGSVDPDDISRSGISGVPFLGAVLDRSDLLLRLEALETRGKARTLAEPNLVALSGQEANFLSGGEFPVPVIQSGVSDAITIEFKEFGVGVKFTPTVLSSDTINLKLQTEVSTIDFDTVTSFGDITVPSVSTRRTGTTIELGDGQSFAIAGLLQENMDNAARQVPGLGNIPVLGALFRSTEFQRSETELAIVVRPRLVSPAPEGSLRLPTDNVVPPSEVDQYLMGRLHGLPDNAARRDRDRDAGEESDGGLEGAWGHEL